MSAPMHSVSVSNNVATIGAGAKLGEVYDALGEHGLTIPTGCGPSVGISGLTLGGGLGILGRKHGLTADSLSGAQVVLADGRILECDENHNEDLFWALRGAGGCNFGILTSLTFETLPAPAATGFHLLWPHTYAAAVIDAWQRWAPAAPDELAASLLVTVSDDLERSPEVNVFGAMLGAESDAVALLDELIARVGRDPASTFFEHASHRETKRYLVELGDAMTGNDGAGSDPPHGVSQEGHPYSKSEFFRRPLPTEAIDTLIDNLTEGRISGQSRELDFSPLGGAYNRVPAGATAFAHRDEMFLLKHSTTIASDSPASEAEAAQRWLVRSWETVHRWGSGGVYPNFPDPELEDWARAYHGTNLERLMRVKERYDPSDFFHFEQSIPVHAPQRGTVM